MAPVAILSTTTEASKSPHEAAKPLKAAEIAGPAEPATIAPPPNAILHRTPWTPPTAVKGEGIYIDLEDGTRMIDGVGGAAVNCIGSGHPKVIQAITDQLQRLTYVYNVQLSNDRAEALGKRLVASSNGAFEQCFFVSGGSEAMEAAIKAARGYFWEIGQPQRKYFIARHLSYHGNTLGALALSSHPGRRAPYEAILEQNVFHHVSPAYYKRFAVDGESEEEYVRRLAQEVEDKFQELGPENVIGFAAEPVVGAAQGVTYAPKGYFKAISDICKRHGALLIYDEVMCGMGRMGKTLHAWQGPNSYTDEVPPDIQAIAKGLGSGYGSIGALLLSPRIVEGFRQGSNYFQHGHTYQAHPLAMAASLAVQDVIEEEDLLEKSYEVGVKLKRLLKEQLTGPSAIAAPYIFDIRGGGCFWGVEFQIPEELELKWFANQRLGGWIQAEAMKNGLIIMGMSGGIDGKKGDFVMLAPSYNIRDNEVEEVVKRLVKSVEAVLGETVLSGWRTRMLKNRL